MTLGISLTQPGQDGNQKLIKLTLPRKSASDTVLPCRSVREKAGAGVVFGGGEPGRVGRVAGNSGKTVGRGEIFYNIFPVKLAVKSVNFWDFCFEFFAVSLRKTAHDVNFFQLTCSFVFHQVQDLIYAFFLGITDKSTSVYHSNIAMQFFWIVMKVAAYGGKLAEEVL